MLIVNADDWGRDRESTDRTLECISAGAVSSVSAMVFMQDSERAAAIARERGIDAGLHLNFTTRFMRGPARLSEHQERIARCLLRHRLAPVGFHAGLIRSFDYAVAAQREEFRRLFGFEPGRIDGHHHMHLCSNVLLGGLLPCKAIVRRSFSFQPGEKPWPNRMYRQGVDWVLARRHRLSDFFFSLLPLEPACRLQRVFSMAKTFEVEVETHPARDEEYRFLAGGRLFQLVDQQLIACGFRLRERAQMRQQI